MRRRRRRRRGGIGGRGLQYQLAWSAIESCRRLRKQWRAETSGCPGTTPIKLLDCDPPRARKDIRQCTGDKTLSKCTCGKTHSKCTGDKIHATTHRRQNTHDNAQATKHILNAQATKYMRQYTMQQNTYDKAHGKAHTSRHCRQNANEMHMRQNTYDQAQATKHIRQYKGDKTHTTIHKR